ncbi:MAG: hypothetical protein MUF78_08785 [Candidatus Edwardsbacteria bacterium]|nr:hypothetical protein [Candidatus Edwardsbacteria bacterium]
MIRRAIYIALTLLSPSFSAVADPGTPRLLVVQSNANNGYLYPCRCPAEPKGGLAKRATLVKALARDAGDFLLFDSGDILGLDSDRATDSLVLAAYQAMGYDAVAVGDQELCRGPEQFIELSRKFRTPFLAANLTYKGRPLARSHVVLKLKDPALTVGVVGAIWPKAFLFYPQVVTQGLEAADPAAALRPLADSLRPLVDVLILLSHLGFDQEVEIARQFPQFDLIVGGHSQTELREADRSGGVPIVEAGSGSKYVSESWLAPADGRWRLSSYRMVGVNSTLADDRAVQAIVGRAPASGHTAVPADQGRGPLAILAFVAPDCPDCLKLEQGLFAQAAARHGDRIRIVYRSVDDPLSYRQLLELEEKLGDRNNKIPAVVAGDRILGGVEEIEQEFLALVAGLAAGGNAPHPKDHSQGTPPPVRDTARTAVPATDSIYLAFVTDARCAKCGRAEYMLKALQARYPNLAVRRFDLQSASDKPMIEALGLLYGVEPGQRLLAPAAYVGDDKLLADQVDDQALAALLEKYKAGTSRVPWRDAQPYLAAAEQGILDRFRHFGLLGVAAAGLLDGINPCSFAVLVFFISYLAFTGRRRWEILAVGVAYTLADFLVYFLIGVGGLSFLMGLKALPAVSRVFYWIAFAAGLVLAVYNFRDFLKARRGDLSGMDLQLSTAAKQRVHRVIRERIGAGGLITGAFITGLITSVLEFACTGQVYLPTIAFVAQIAPLRAQAYGYLLLYNLMFEVPMIATFVIAFWGVSSKAIGDWARRSVPAVKLATALLFLGMSAVLLLVLAG